MRRTKIVCTLGPSSSSPDAIRGLIESGMDVARLNFSHGTHEFHQATFQSIRTAASALGRNVAIMADLQGPKIRTGTLRDGKSVELVEGAAICITARTVVGDAACVSTTYEHLPLDVRAGDRILLADGVMELRVEKAEPPDVFCRVVRGGLLGEHKGINLPGVNVSAPSLTEKDIVDLAFAMGLGVDYVALSFVRSANDIRAIKQRIRTLGGTELRPGVVAKIERPEALAQFDEILALTDGVMVARGDLGVEADLDDVPQVQKELIRCCNGQGKPVITATQMLESMTASPRPTRAEVSDVANAIYDGTDAVMLSAETAAGQFPLEAVREMARIAQKADEAIAERAQESVFRPSASNVWKGSHSNAIAEAVSRMAVSLDIACVVCFTMSGYTARVIARYRPHTPITAITHSEETSRRCALVWGVDTLQSVEVAHIDDVVRTVDGLVLEHHLAGKDDTIVIVAGMPLAIGGVTNLLKLHTIGSLT